MKTPILFVIRHGRTSFNQKGLFRGEADIPLVEQGFKDAEEAYKELEDIDPSFIVSSDKKRAVQTAEILSNHFGVPHTDTPQLRAWNLGDLSGQPKNKENLQLVEEHVKNSDEKMPGGESLNEFRDRVLPVLAECFAHATKVGPGIVVAHSSVIHELGTQLFQNHKSLVVQPGGIVVIGLDNGEVTADRIFKALRSEEGAASVS